MHFVILRLIVFYAIAKRAQLTSAPHLSILSKVKCSCTANDRDIYLCDQSSRRPVPLHLGGLAAADSLDERSTRTVELVRHKERKGGQRGASHRAINHRSSVLLAPLL